MFLKKDIFKVIRNRDNEGLIDLLNRYPDLINKKSTGGYSLLEIAIISKGKKNDIIKTLVERGANVNDFSTKMKTPLAFILVRNNNAEAVNIMLEHGLKTTFKDSNGYGFLEIAFFYQATKVLEVLKKYMSIKDDLFVLLEQEDNNKFISEFTKEKRNKAYINQEKGKYSLLEKAVLNENREIITFLLKQPYLNINRINKSGYNLSSRITLPGNEDILNEFIHAGFLQNNRDRKQKNTLYYAIENKNINAIKILLNNNAELFSNKKYACAIDSNLIKAYQSHSFEITDLIYKYALNFVSNPKEIYSPFLYFMSVGLFSQVEEYKKYHPEMDYYETDINGVNCLHLAIKYRHHSFLDYILSNLDIEKLNIPDKYGFYPCDYLLNVSANNIQNFVNKLPDNILRPYEHKSVLNDMNNSSLDDIEVIMQPNATYNSKSGSKLNELSLLDRAVYTKDTAIFKTLYERGVKFRKLNIQSAAVIALMSNQTIKISSSVSSYNYALFTHSKDNLKKLKNKTQEFLLYLIEQHLSHNIDFPLFDKNNILCDLAENCLSNNIIIMDLNDNDYYKLTFLELVKIVNPEIYSYFDSYFLNKHLSGCDKNIVSSAKKVRL